VWGASLRSRMSSSIRCRSGEISWVESFMALLRLRYEAECLTSQLTKQNRSGQPTPNARSKPPLPRERFSPLAGSRGFHPHYRRSTRDDSDRRGAVASWPQEPSFAITLAAVRAGRPTLFHGVQRQLNGLTNEAIDAPRRPVTSLAASRSGPGSSIFTRSSVSKNSKWASKRGPIELHQRTARDKLRRLAICL